MKNSRPNHDRSGYLRIQPFQKVEALNAKYGTRMVSLKTLSEVELETFYEEIDHDKDGQVTLEELESQLTKTLSELAPEPARHPLKGSAVPEEYGSSEKEKIRSDLRNFLLTLLPLYGQGNQSISKEEFLAQVKSWHVPSLSQNSGDVDCEDQVNEYDRKLPRIRKLRAVSLIPYNLIKF